MKRRKRRVAHDPIRRRLRKRAVRRTRKTRGAKRTTPRLTAKPCHSRRTPRRGKRARKVENLRRNPASVHVIEALTLNGTTPRYFYWDDTTQKFTTKREQASPYKSERTAYIEAKKLMPRLPAAIRSLRVVTK